MFYYEGHKRFQRDHKSFLLGTDADRNLTSCLIPAQKDLCQPLDFRSSRHVYVPKPGGGYQLLCSSLLMHLLAAVLEHIAVRSSGTPALCVCVSVFACACAFVFAMWRTALMDVLPILAWLITLQVDVTSRNPAEYVHGISVSYTHTLGRRARLHACLRAWPWPALMALNFLHFFLSLTSDLFIFPHDADI